MMSAARAALSAAASLAPAALARSRSSWSRHADASTAAWSAPGAAGIRMATPIRTQAPASTGCSEPLGRTASGPPRSSADSTGADVPLVRTSPAWSMSGPIHGLRTSTMSASGAGRGLVERPCSTTAWKGPRVNAAFSSGQWLAPPKNRPRCAYTTGLPVRARRCSYLLDLGPVRRRLPGQRPDVVHARRKPRSRVLERGVAAQQQRRAEQRVTPRGTAPAAASLLADAGVQAQGLPRPVVPGPALLGSPAPPDW